MRYIRTFEYFGDGEFADFDNDADEKFWGNVAAGCLPICTSTKRILLNYRSIYVNEPHTWSVSGGKIEDDEDIEYGARRELYEETGYNKNIKMIPIFIFRNENKTFEYHNFIGIIDNEFKPKLNWESEDFKWLTFDELLNIEPKHPGLELLLNDEYSLNVIKDIVNE
jgi:8-oxo-dGTP pyrophosphatase MutT (NUDIX family)